MKLYIAEKPSLGRAIAEGLEGRKKSHQGYIETDRGEVVTWCIGHLLEQAEPDAYDPKYKRWSLEHLPIQPQTWIAQPKKNTKSQLGIIRKLGKQAKEIIHAGDPDREGQLLVDEVIAHLKLPAKITQSVKRLLISDLNVASVKKQLGQLRSNQEFRALSTSALARTRADWLYGMNLSRAYTLKGQQTGFNGVVSIGRVQTPVLGLIVKRDLEIESFEQRPYYELYAQIEVTNQLQAISEVIQAKWLPSEACEPYTDEEGRVIHKPLVEHVAKKIQDQPALLGEKRSKDKTQNAPLPLNLSALQIEASKRYSISAKETLDICQSLYETRKLITYPRSDNRYLPEEHFSDRFSVVESIEHNLKQIQNNGNAFPLKDSLLLNKKSKAFDSKKVGAHHGIIPTSLTANNLERLNAKEKKIYALIACYYLIQFSDTWKYCDLSALFIIDGGRFQAKQRVTVDLGWKLLLGKLLGYSQDGVDNAPNGSLNSSRQTNGAVRVNSDSLSNPATIDSNPSLTNLSQSNLSQSIWEQLTEGGHYPCIGSNIQEKITNPPAHYNDGTLLSALTGISRFVKDQELKAILKETDGLGTEATRAGIIELLLKRKFIQRHGKQITATETGKSLIQGLPEHLALPDRTAKWEMQLDCISRREIAYQDFMDSLSKELVDVIEIAKVNGIRGLKPLARSPFKKRRNSGQKKAYRKKGYTSKK